MIRYNTITKTKEVCRMGTNKVNKEPMKSTHTESLGGSLLKMAAIGLAGGIALISLADKVGKTLLHEKDRELDESEEKRDCELFSVNCLLW